ncbi:MAG: homoserine dehydrogenase [Methylacidiphilales bacterium]|nr:homoserine dehydrogenase [Candidatus Methylacidiphilales bacterium]
MKNFIGIGVIGYGVVGSGTVAMLLKQQEKITRLVGLPVRVVALARKQQINPFPELDTIDFYQDVDSVINHPNVNIVVELIGGTSEANRIVTQALLLGKPVVTANKALIAMNGHSLFALARTHQTVIKFEAAVAGAIPIIEILQRSLSVNTISSIVGVLNGTCNFILNTMRDTTITFDQALALAKKNGFAEANPVLDVDGSDTLHKMLILVMLTHDVLIPFESCSRVGITEVDIQDIQYGQQYGYQLKLLAKCFYVNGELSIRVEPTFVDSSSMLGQLPGPMNGVEVSGNFCGTLFFAGSGAGSFPTAASVVADCVSLAKELVSDARISSRNLLPQLSNHANDNINAPWFIRLQVFDQPGSLTQVTNLFASESINIDSITQNHQYACLNDQGVFSVPIILITECISHKQLNEIVIKLEKLSIVTQRVVKYPIYKIQ